jgi:hypothetical protein
MRIVYLLSPRKVALILASIAVFFALQSLVMEYLIENVLDQVHHSTFIQLIDLFSVNAEQAIPTWYSILLLFGAALLVANIAFAERTRQQPYTVYWMGLALIFLYLSIDEGAVIHEIASDAIQVYTTTTGYLTFPWLVVAAPLVIIFGLLYARFLFVLQRRTALLFILAGVIYIGGAMGIEAVSANHYSLGGGVSFSYLAIATVEELCEMLGIVVFIYALLSYTAEKQYSFAFIPTWDNTVDTSVTTANVSHSSILPPSRRLLAFIAALVIVANGTLITWATSQPPRTEADEESIVIQTVIDQFPAENVVMTRLIGRFGGDNPAARQLVAGLLEVYDDVLVITLPTHESSLAFAADELPFDRDEVIELLHGVGQTQFVIFDTPVVRALVGSPTAK